MATSLSERDKDTLEPKDTARLEELMRACRDPTCFCRVPCLNCQKLADLIAGSPAAAARKNKPSLQPLAAWNP